MLLLWGTVACKCAMPNNRACRAEKSCWLHVVPGAETILKGMPLPLPQGQAWCWVLLHSLLNRASIPHGLQTRTLPKSKAKEVKYYLHEHPWTDNGHLSLTKQICVFPWSDYWVTLNLYIHLFTGLSSLWWLQFSSVFSDILLSFKLFLSTYV